VWRDERWADVAVRGAGRANVAFRGGKLIQSAAIGLDTRKRGIVAFQSACFLMQTAEPTRAAIRKQQMIASN
jgi:hypothetical protein